MLFLVAYGVGETIGPLVVKMFERVDFRLGGLHVTYGNVGALVLLMINTIRIVTVYFFTYDLSKEFDLKAHEKQTIEPSTAESSELSTLREYMCLDAVLLLIQQIYTGFLTSFIGRAFPLVISTLKYSNDVLDGCFMAASILMTIISIIIALIKPSNQGVYICGIVSVLALLLAQSVLFLIPMGLSNPLNIVLLSILVSTYALSYITDSTYIILTLGNLFPSSVQSSSEGLRMCLHKAGSLVASLLSIYIYNNFFYVFFGSVLLGVLFLVVMFVRRDELKIPKGDYESLE